MQGLLEDLRARDFSPRAILDVGAHRGDWSRVAKGIWPQADCFLIEPQAEMGPDLEQFCRDFPGARWFQAGAGSTPGELTLTVRMDDLGGSHFLTERTEEGVLNPCQQRRVPIVTIDGLLDRAEIPLPQLAKLDVQGFELEVLRGGTKLFGATEVFILEVSLFEFMKGQPIFHEVVAFMAERGYGVYDVPGFLRRPRDGALGQVDLCFVKLDGILRRDRRW
jgi:FkbM family methyltransferase